MATRQKLTDQQIKEDKTSRIMQTVAERASYYRANPHRFCSDYLFPETPNFLKTFQKILIWAMIHSDSFCFIACRGIGKTFLVALFSVIKCILFPGTKIVVSSATFKQSKELVGKITDDFMHRSAMLRTEIERTSTGQNDCGVWFKNGSFLVCRVANENARGARCNVLIIDESRLVPKNIIDDIFVPMLNAPRAPGYLSKPEYAHLAEVGQKLFLSSAWYKQSELYSMLKGYTINMLKDDSRFFACDLPYQLSIASNIMMRETIENVMADPDFNDISFMMEYEGKFYGSGEDSLFKLDVLEGRRTLKECFHDLDYYKSNNIKIPAKQFGEKRVLSVDIALLASRRHANDASCFVIEQLIPNGDSGYISNIVYMETAEGLVTEELGLMTMRYFYQYDCDYLAIDANGVGQSVLDYVMADRYDALHGTTYGAIQTVDNPDLNERCKVKNAPKVIYAIKANAKSNNDMALALRAGLQNGNINLLVSENNIEDELSKIVKGYNKLPLQQQIRLKVPYLQTTFLIEELINLEHDIVNGLVKVKERSGMRKDRYSALQYAYYVSQELTRKLKPKTTNTDILKMVGVSKKPKTWGRY